MEGASEPIRMSELSRNPQHCETTSSRHPEPDTIIPVVPDAISESVLEELTKNLDCWERYFTSMMAIAFFGGQITFTTVLSDIYDPEKVFARGFPRLLGFSKEKVRQFVCLAFLFFYLTLHAAAVGKLILANPTTKTRILRSLRNKKYLSLKCFTVTACCIDYCPMLASLFLGLAVGAYVPGVGLTVTVIFTLSLLCKMFWGHVVIPDHGKPWSFRLVAASSLWQGSL
jgi:hypothetical protein